MNLSAEQLQIASLISHRVQELARTGLDDVRIFAEMADYMPGLKRSWTPRRGMRWMRSVRSFQGFIATPRSWNALLLAFNQGKSRSRSEYRQPHMRPDSAGKVKWPQPADSFGVSDSRDEFL